MHFFGRGQAFLAEYVLLGFCSKWYACDAALLFFFQDNVCAGMCCSASAVYDTLTVCVAGHF